MHVETVPQELGLVSPALLQAHELGHVEVLLQDRNVVGVSALFDNHAG